ncbi:MAG: hypothetical protein ACR2N7_07965 [Acidimicrobiia bacterium]
MIVLTLIAAGAIVAFLVSRQTEQRGTVEFFAAADESSMLHQEASASLEATLSQIGPLLTRPEVTRRLADVTAKAAEADALLAIEVPSSIGNIYGPMATASASWAAGTADLESAILGIMDGDVVGEPDQAVQDALDLLRVGDTAHVLFRESLVDAPEDVVVPEIEPVTYINPNASDPALYDAVLLSLRVSSAYNLTPIHDVGVQGMTIPEPVGDRDGIPLVPFGDSLGIQAVVTNAGNELQTAIEVDLQLVTAESGEIHIDSITVAELEAFASTTVVFADLPVEPGGLYQATVTATITEDSNPENDEWTMTFDWNGAS